MATDASQTHSDSQEQQAAASPPPPRQRSAPPEEPRDDNPSRVRPETSPEGEATGSHAGDEQRASEQRAEPGDAPEAEPTRLFAEALAFMNANGGCNMNLMLAPADGGKRVRLTITGQHRDSGEDAPSGDAPSGPPFKPITLKAAPAQLDASSSGLERFLRERTDQVQTLRQARERAEEAHEQAVEAEERRKKKAKQKKAEHSENGPLFSGDDDSSEEDVSEEDDFSEENESFD